MVLRIPPPRARAHRALRSTLLFSWRAHDLALDALTGQAGTFVRDGAGAARDGAGVAYTAPARVPAWDVADGVPGLLTGGDGTVAEHLTWPIAFPPQTFTLLWRFRLSGTPVAAANTLVQLGLGASDTGPGWRIGVQADGDIEVVRRGVNTTVATQVHGEQPPGSRLMLLLHVTAAGAMTSTLHDGDGVPISTQGPSSATALPSAWGADVLRLGNAGTTATQRHAHEILRIAPGALTLDAMLAQL